MKVTFKNEPHQHFKTGSIVKVNGMVVPQDPVNGWQYRADTNSVVFLGTYVPPPGAEIRLEYAFSKT